MLRRKSQNRVCRGGVGEKRGTQESNGEEIFCEEMEMQTFGDFGSESGIEIIQCIKIPTSE